MTTTLSVCCPEPYEQHTIVPILSQQHPYFPGALLISHSLFLHVGALAPLRPGTLLLDTNSRSPLVHILSRSMLPNAVHANTSPADSPHAVPCLYAKTLAPLSRGTYDMALENNSFSLAWVTISDKGASKDRIDASGPLIAEYVCKTLPISHSQGFIIPDDPQHIRALVTDLALHQGYSLIITTGGTGLSPRDTTPEAILPILDRQLHGISHAMMAESLTKTPTAMLSRAFAGTIGASLIIALPGSKKAVAENLQAALPALHHALDKLHGSTQDCGAPTTHDTHRH